MAATMKFALEKSWAATPAQKAGRPCVEPRSAAESHDRQSDGAGKFPQEIVSPMAWTGTDFEGPGYAKYTSRLDRLEIQELEQACRHFEGMSILQGRRPYGRC